MDEPCGGLFENKNAARFCSNACRTAKRRESGVDDETRECAHCKTSFTVNKYSRKRFCGNSCAAKHQHART